MSNLFAGAHIQKHFFRRIMATLSLVRTNMPKSCPVCADLDAATTEFQLNLNRQKLACDPEEIQRWNLLVDQCRKRIEFGMKHQTRMRTTRPKITKLRDNLGPREQMLTVDFGSWWRPDGKSNCLTFVLERVVDGLLERIYVDYPADDPSHDHYFFKQAYEHLFYQTDHIIDQSTGKPKFDTVYRVSDNGNPLMSKEATLVESRVCHMTGIKIEVLPYCGNHAWSMADSHLGHLKPALKRMLVTAGLRLMASRG